MQIRSGTRVLFAMCTNGRTSSRSIARNRNFDMIPRIAGEWKDRRQATEWITSSLDNPNGFNHLIELLPSDSSTEYTAIGSVGSPRAGELGYMFHPSYWGKGYATEAVMAFLKTYYEIMGPGAGNIVAHTDSENEASKKVLVKCGFKQVGREPCENVTLGMRESVIFQYSPPEQV